jgi:hypothetical protein
LGRIEFGQFFLFLPPFIVLSLLLGLFGSGWIDRFRGSSRTSAIGGSSSLTTSRCRSDPLFRSRLYQHTGMQ